MDDLRFDHLARALGGASSRRAALAALAALLAGGAALDAEAKRRGAGAARRRRKKKCDPACGAGQTCAKGTCTCGDGGAACGAACCLAGQRCEGETCADPAPACHAAAEACGDGTPCCDGLQCGSGQGGGAVACWPVPGGACEETADCGYGSACVDGACVPDPVEPSCTPTTCDAANATCGTVPDGCDGTLDCGTCPAPQTCGGAGTANACGCAPVTCATGKEQDPATCQCVCTPTNCGSDKVQDPDTCDCVCNTAAGLNDCGNGQCCHVCGNGAAAANGTALLSAIASPTRPRILTVGDGTYEVTAPAATGANLSGAAIYPDAALNLSYCNGSSTFPTLRCKGPGNSDWNCISSKNGKNVGVYGFTVQGDPASGGKTSTGVWANDQNSSIGLSYVTLTGFDIGIDADGSLISPRDRAYLSVSTKVTGNATGIGAFAGCQNTGNSSCANTTVNCAATTPAPDAACGCVAGTGAC